jgi:chorismate synthase
MLRFLTAGESHGKMLIAILEGLPSNLELRPEDINEDLARRQQGYGRGPRSISIEKDKADIISGVYSNKTTGSPIGLVIENKDWENRKKTIAKLTVPRPGHADLCGILKYNLDDINPVLERASARNTASIVAVGSVCKKYLKFFGIDIVGYVKSIGDVDAGIFPIKDIKNFRKNVESSLVRCPDKNMSQAMIKKIDQAKASGDTLGGEVCIEIVNVPVGLGSYMQYDTRLDSMIAESLMSIPSVKYVCIGESDVSKHLGSHVHDPIIYDKKKKFHHTSNNCGGIEGGISNGEPIRVIAGLKPIPTLLKPLDSVDIKTKKAKKAVIVRSDVCVAPSAVVVAEAMLGFAIAKAHRQKFGGDSIQETKSNVENSLKQK